MGMRLDDPAFEPEGDLASEDPEEVEVEDTEGQEPSGKEPTGSEPPEPDDGEEDIPDEYFGYRLADIEDPEAKKATYEALQEANRVANRRLQEIAELRKEAEKETRKPLPEQQAPEEVDYTALSDEELLEQAGIDSSILEYAEVGKPVAEMVRRQLQLEQKLESVAQTSEAEAWERNFYGKLDNLESEFGKLPFSREDVETFALENDIYNPDALYWTIMGPVIREAATQQTPKPDPQRQALKRQVGRQPKRRTSPDGATTAQKPKSLKEAFEVAKQAQNIPAGYDPFAHEE